MSTHPTTWTNALRPETRVKERRSNLPPALEWRLDGILPPSIVRPMKNDSRRSHLHSGTSHTPDMKKNPKMKRLKKRRGRDKSRLRKESRLGREKPETPINEAGKTPEVSCRCFREETQRGDKAG
ncbi:hypothetical protein HID58_063231 [Brassica napus]|uniref:Uncharacterized protein n=2 Tax=Brassica TaxID=3705 RepID=A0ABQ8A3P2_BRANA|nr:hypothetical protein F2Q69_00017697 [Brassica cretica]KAH0887135.1 hypothetical protein HID58_063231 [Brassica napus]